MNKDCRFQQIKVYGLIKGQEFHTPITYYVEPPIQAITITTDVIICWQSVKYIILGIIDKMLKKNVKYSIVKNKNLKSFCVQEHSHRIIVNTYLYDYIL